MVRGLGLLLVMIVSLRAPRPSEGGSSRQATRLLARIARVEGYGKRGTIATRQCNPGALRAGAYTRSWGAARGARGFADFTKAPGGCGAGYGAAHRLLENKLRRGKTIASIIAAWAPASENDTKRYLREVSR